MEANDEPAAVCSAKDLRVLTQRFRHAMTKSVQGIIEAGKVLIDAKKKLKRGQFTDWVVQELRFGSGKDGSPAADIRKAEYLMMLARHEVISDPNQWFALPPSWRTLYELTQIHPKQRLLKLIEKGKVHAGMSREDAIELQPKAKRVARQKLGKLHRQIATLLEVCLSLGGPERVQAHIRGLKSERNDPSVQMFDEAVRWAKPQLEKQEGEK